MLSFNDAKSINPSSTVKPFDAKAASEAPYCTAKAVRDSAHEIAQAVTAAGMAGKATHRDKKTIAEPAPASATFCQNAFLS